MYPDFTLIFLDLRGAFDRIPRNLLIAVLRIMFGSEKIANILESIHTDTTANIKNGSETIKIDAGVRQGSDEGPNCFNAFFEYVLLVCEREIASRFAERRKIEVEKNGEKSEKFKKAGVKFDFNIKSESDNNSRRGGIFTGSASGIEHLLKLLYCDDLCLFSESIEELQLILDVMVLIFDKFGLIIAEDKTKSMVLNVEKFDKTPLFNINSTNSIGEPININLEHVEAFTYLGIRASATDKNLFLNNQLQAGWAAFNKHKNSICNRRIHLHTRINLLNSLVRSVFLYSCQATKHTKAQEKKLDALYNTFLRKMVNKGWKSSVVDDDGNYSPTITNIKLHEITKTEPVKEFVQKQFLRYQGHITRLPNSKLQKQLQFTGNSDVFWNYCGSLLGGMSSEQARRTLHEKTVLENAIRLQFG